MYFLIVLFSSNNNYCSSPMRKGLAAPLRIETNDLVSIGKYAGSDLAPPPNYTVIFVYVGILPSIEFIKRVAPIIACDNAREWSTA